MLFNFNLQNLTIIIIKFIYKKISIRRHLFKSCMFLRIMLSLSLNFLEFITKDIPFQILQNQVFLFHQLKSFRFIKVLVIQDLKLLVIYQIINIFENSKYLMKDLNFLIVSYFTLFTFFILYINLIKILYTRGTYFEFYGSLIEQYIIII